MNRFRKIHSMMESRRDSLPMRDRLSRGLASKSPLRVADFRHKRVTVFLGTVLASFLLHTTVSFATGGISGTKLIVPSANPLEKWSVEAEPFFSLEFVDDGEDTVKAGGGFRLTAGLLDDLEAGVNINYLNIEDSVLIRAESNFGDIEAGIKLRFLDQEKGHPFSLAYQGGVTFPLGDGALWIVEPAGVILTKDFTDEFSMDADFVFGIIESDSRSFVADIGFGYYLGSWFQPVIEAACAYEDPEGEGGISIINMSLGFTADIADWFSLSLGATPDIYVNNTARQVIISSAFTFLF